MVKQWMDKWMEELSFAATIKWSVLSTMFGCENY
jgi:hypothetical protein